MDYATAAERFQQFLKEHAEHKLAAEAGFMVGDALQRSTKLAEAAAAFETSFNTFAPHEQAFLAGLQAARLRAQLKQTDEANRIYKAVEAQFAKRPEHDQLLNEWALVLYEAERYVEADALFQRITNEHPDSSVADNAQFSLAESDLVNGELQLARTSFAALTADAAADANVREDSLFRIIGIDADTGKWTDVMASADKFAKQFPDSEYAPAIQFHLGNGQLNLGRFLDAEKTFSRLVDGVAEPAIGQSEWVGHLWALLAECQVRQKNYAAVMTTAQKARAWKADSPTHYMLDEVVGRAWKSQAKFTEATAAFKRVIQSETGSRTETAAKAQLMIAEILFLQKKYPEARDGYLTVHFLYKFPEWQAPALFQAGQCEELIGSKDSLDGARKWYQTLQAEFGDSDFATRAADRLKILGSSS